jgi:hypothetical protein
VKPVWCDGTDEVAGIIKRILKDEVVPYDHENGVDDYR